MKTERYVDLHVHSLHSDGVHTPAALVKMAARKGLQAIALADHDSVSGLDDALAAGERHGVEVIPAVELSVEFRGYRDVHLLGYFIDYRDAIFRERLALFRARRDERGRAIIARINEKLGLEGNGNISYEEVHALAAGALGRPHIAQVLIAHGIARDVQDAFDRYVVPCNVPKRYFAMADALAEIRRLRGLSVLAHPTTVTDDRTALRALVTELAAMGLDGVEVFNNSCYGDDMIFLESMANRLGLVKTGGSDYHGIEDDVEMGSGRGALTVAYRWVEELKKRRAEREAQP
ncbi:MAG TPA: PHP domain-containing protein [Geobacteraceae bacterium]